MMMEVVIMMKMMTELNDLLEQQYGTNPNNYDTDGDGLTDWFEIINGFDPLDYNDPTNNDKQSDW